MRVLKSAQRGLYPMDRATQLPPALLKKYCRKGTGPQAGYLLVDRALRERVSFSQINLVQTLPQTPLFDMIFLRNVMIYFDAATKAAVVARLIERLKPGGTFCVGLAETLNGIATGLRELEITKVPNSTVCHCGLDPQSRAHDGMNAGSSPA